VAVPSTPDTLTGRVVAVNPKGLKLADADQWINFSQFAQDLVPPMRGQTVTVTLDRQGYIRSVAVTSGAQEPTTARQASAGVKDRTITRLAVLKATAEFAASRSEASSSDVLKVAEAWERWVLRPYDGAELTDAF
jgi:hypothetical protein